MGGGTILRPARGTDPEARVTALIARHGASLLRTAQKVSLCADDAHDAYQRALEIYLRRLDTVDVATELHWMRVVVRNEALAVRKQRSQHLAGEDVDWEAHGDDDQRPVDERLAAEERVRRSAEVMRQLKPDEARALLLKAQGHSYDEIGRRYGWTYTKVNRSLAEGRKRFFTLFAAVEAGEACEALTPTLAAVALGEATADELLSLRPHLRHCARCRAEVRRLHGGWAAALSPFPVLFDRLRSEAATLLGRFADPLAASAASGGGRSTAVAALAAVCVGGAGAGGYCAVTGQFPDPVAIVRAADAEPEPRPDPEPRAEAPAEPTPSPSPEVTPDPVGPPRVVPTAEPTPAPRPERPSPTPTAAPPEPAPAPAPPPPVASPAPAPPPAPEEFEFEQAAPAPAPAPSTSTRPAAAAQPAAAPPPASSGSGSSGEGFGFER